MGFKFEKPVVWQKSVNQSVDIHHLIREFLKSELFGLFSHIKNVAGSVSVDIAECSTGQFDADFRRLKGVCDSRKYRGSCLSVTLTKKRNLPCPDFEQLHQQREELLAVHNSLRNSLN